MMQKKLAVTLTLSEKAAALLKKSCAKNFCEFGPVPVATARRAERCAKEQKFFGSFSSKENRLFARPNAGL